MRIFISAGEPSGDLHGGNLVRTLRALHPGVECVGFGGPNMKAAGCRLVYPLTDLAVMWFARVFASIHVFLSLLSKTDRIFRHDPPDAVVLIDYPGFNWWVARRARFHGIPVYYFVPPQLWGWAGWRVEKMRRFVDHVLCALPFEEAWYRERGVEATYVGHPYFDALPLQQFDAGFLEAERQRGGTVVGLLPGSRRQELDRNLKTMLRAAGRIHAARPDARFAVACFREAHAEIVRERLRKVELPVDVHVGRTPEIIRLSRLCLAVSGSVGLELLYQVRPTVVLYRIGRLDMKVCNIFKTSRFISLVNMLADKELFPEFLTDHCVAEEMSRTALAWLEDDAAYESLCRELRSVRDRVAAPGACARSARFILDRLASPAARLRRAS